MDLNKIKADIALAEKGSPSGWMLELATLREWVDLTEKQEAQLRADAQALADSNLVLMEQTELADKLRKQVETLEAELVRERAALAAQSAAGVGAPGCNYLMTAGNVCNKCGQIHQPPAPTAPVAGGDQQQKS